MKELFRQWATIVKTMITFPVLIIVAVVLFGFTIWADVKLNDIVVTILLIGDCVVIGTLVPLFIFEEKAKEYILKILLFTLFWFCSCVALVDFSKVDFKLVTQIITSAVFIFLGCLIPDMMSNYSAEHDRKEKEFQDLKKRVIELEGKFETKKHSEVNKNGE